MKGNHSNEKVHRDEKASEGAATPAEGSGAGSLEPLGPTQPETDCSVHVKIQFREHCWVGEGSPSPPDLWTCVQAAACLLFLL